MTAVHQTPFSGSWYPGDAVELTELLRKEREQSEERTGPYLPKDALAFVVPHAGISYSGTVAAAAYRCLRQRNPALVVILGFCHSRPLHGVGVPKVGRYVTPLGEVPVADFAAARLDGRAPFLSVSEALVCDHSLEIQLPLLQHYLPGVPVLPLYVGRLEERERRAAAEALAPLLAEGAVFLASSDFTHYGPAFRFVPFPADSHVSDRLRDLDDRVIDGASSLDAEFFLAALHASHATVCGPMPISLLLETLALHQDGEVYQQVLDYQTSGEITGDFDLSVGYAAIGYFPRRAYELDEHEQELLLDAAWRTLELYHKTGRRAPQRPRERTPNLPRRAPAFVSLHRDGELLGCVGQVHTLEPLEESVPALTLSAATEDPRFAPLKPDAPIDGIDLEISVLTPSKRLVSRDRFRLGEHGAHVEAGARRGLLLPQVAAHGEWTTDRFFDVLAAKAGCAPSIYRQPATKLHTFRAQVFGRGRRVRDAG